MSKIGILLNNIGTPLSPEPKDVGIYLSEFLMDPDVISLPYLFRLLLVKGIIVPIRSRKSSLKYKAIWTSRGSPLQFLTEDLKNKLQSFLGDKYSVKIGMRYGSLPLKQALQEFQAEGVSQLVFAPMFPQFAEATTASAIKYFESLNKVFNFKYKVLDSFYNKNFFINNFVKIIEEKIQNQNIDHMIFSYHGLPESQIKKNPTCLQVGCCQKISACEKNCYKAQCHKTSELLAKKLNISSDQWETGFQSRLGPTKWIGPSTSELIQRLNLTNKKNVFICSPSFVIDCLETVEEIGIELNDQFRKTSGKDLKVIPCLNDHQNWANDFSTHLKEIHFDN